MGGGAPCRIMSSMAALSAGMLTWGVHYRMPPLHPYPAALDDVAAAAAVYRGVLDGGVDAELHGIESMAT